MSLRSSDITPSYLSDIEKTPPGAIGRGTRQAGEFPQSRLRRPHGPRRPFRGVDAVRYMMRTPAAGVLLRRLADGKASDKTVQE